LTAHEAGNCFGVESLTTTNYCPIIASGGKETSDEDDWSKPEVNNSHMLDDEFNEPQVLDDVNEPDDDDEMNYELKYCRLQEELYEECYSIDCLSSKDLQTFVRTMPPYADGDVLMAALDNFKRRAGISRDSGHELLRIIRCYSRPDLEVPSDWRTVKRYVDKKSDILKAYTLRRVVPWPESFRMDLFDEPGQQRPPAVELIARDLLELVALKLVCPTTQFINASEVQYEYASEFLSDGTSCTSNLMSSNFAKYSERTIRGYNRDGLLIPIITYSDGVALGVRNKVIVLCMYVCIPYLYTLYVLVGYPT
jgi:hypothetical protein